MSSKLLFALTSILALAAAAPHAPARECTVKPTSTSTSKEPTAATATPGTKAHPQHFNIYQVDQPNHGTDNVPHLDLHTNITRQVVVFDGIPATAKSCSLNWRQGPIATRVFRVQGSGLVSSRQLKSEGFPVWTPGSDVLINPTTIKPFQGSDDDFSTGLDFTLWDAPEYPDAQPHGGPGVKCEERIVVELAVNLNNGQDGRVFMQDDAENGLYISYS
ncbi:hypothetical protein CSOJ01_15505 [Colletotrichum sojae]|uniref:Ubiquitin 3 binding protein But2 C-terminal domain-containing protein n=1 Tax=Colletotrichum sojae TaxID=2175907 RepID=A0A8H6MI10_9PEZI|nr:hypothetical protein CSOJ01_15505 [Colletotrichum sojae]